MIKTKEELEKISDVEGFIDIEGHGKIHKENFYGKDFQQTVREFIMEWPTEFTVSSDGSVASFPPHGWDKIKGPYLREHPDFPNHYEIFEDWIDNNPSNLTVNPSPPPDYYRREYTLEAGQLVFVKMVQCQYIKASEAYLKPIE